MEKNLERLNLEKIMPIFCQIAKGINNFRVQEEINGQKFDIAFEKTLDYGGAARCTYEDGKATAQISIRCSDGRSLDISLETTREYWTKPLGIKIEGIRLFIKSINTIARIKWSFQDEALELVHGIPVGSPYPYSRIDIFNENYDDLSPYFDAIEFIYNLAYFNLSQKGSSYGSKTLLAAEKREKLLEKLGIDPSFSAKMCFSGYELDRIDEVCRLNLVQYSLPPSSLDIFKEIEQWQTYKKSRPISTMLK